MVSRVALIGFMAAGKSTVARQLADVWNWTVVDTDDLVTQQQKKSPAAYLQEYGEQKFRQVEYEALKSVLPSHNVVCATGGGIVTDLRSRTVLRDNFYVVWLRIQAKTAIARIFEDGTVRPLVSANPEERVRTLILQRAPLYAQGADSIVDVDGKRPEDIVREIQMKVPFIDNMK